MAVKKLGKKKTSGTRAKASKINAKAKIALISKKATPVNKAFTKTEILGEIVAMVTQATQPITQKQAGAVLDSLQNIIGRHLKKGGPGAFVLPGLLKCQVVHKPATKARKGINPFTGEETMFKAKPARNIVKVKALKKLKEMV